MAKGLRILIPILVMSILGSVIMGAWTGTPRDRDPTGPRLTAEALWSHKCDQLVFRDKKGRTVDAWTVIVIRDEDVPTIWKRRVDGYEESRWLDQELIDFLVRHGATSVTIEEAAECPTDGHEEAPSPKTDSAQLSVFSIPCQVFKML